MASGASKTEAKRVSKKPIWPRVYPKPRLKGTLQLRFLTEAKSYDLLASPQYASVPEPVQNSENNRCQRPFLHQWILPSSIAILVNSLSSLISHVINLLLRLALYNSVHQHDLLRTTHNFVLIVGVRLERHFGALMEVLKVFS